MAREELRDLAGGANQLGVRNHNERLILSTIQHHRALPGSEIARRTGLTPQTVSVILRKLEGEGLLGRGDPIRGAVGKPRVPMALKADGLFSLGAKVGRRTIDVVLVQPNYEPHYEKFERVSEYDQITRFIELSLPRLDAEVDYLVFPETSYGFVEERDVRAQQSTLRLTDAFAPYPDLKLVTGLNAYHDFAPGEPLTAAARQRQAHGRTVDFEVMNLAAQIPMNPDEAPQTYRKSKLVPGPEAFPFRRLLFFMEPVVDQLGGTTAGLGTQPKRTSFTSPTARVAPVICYESVFGEYFAAYVIEGEAQAAFIMTNDGWWDNTAGHRQHLYYASLRAIETRRSIGRSANTGISAFINQRGDILQPTRYGVPFVIRGELTLNEAVTFYARWQDLIARTALFLAIVLLLNTFVKSRLQK